MTQHTGGQPPFLPVLSRLIGVLHRPDSTGAADGQSLGIRKLGDRDLDTGQTAAGGCGRGRTRGAGPEAGLAAVEDLIPVMAPPSVDEA